MSSYEEEPEFSGDDADYLVGDDDASSADELPDLEGADRIDNDEEVPEEDDIDIVDTEAEVPDTQPVIATSDVSDRNHKIITVVPDDERVTSNIIQRPEMTEAIGIRASQIEQGSAPLTDVEGYTDFIAMAKKEFVDRRNPLIIERALYDSPIRATVEHWRVREMTFPITDRETLMISSAATSETRQVKKKQ
jgi:DNA-directed RNA polymerase subunit K/omega